MLKATRTNDHGTLTDRGTRSVRHSSFQAASLLVLILTGCEQPLPEDAPAARAVSAAAAHVPASMLTADELRRRLGTDDRAVFRRAGTEIVEALLVNTGIRTIEPLRGLPLRKLDLGFCSRITDISAVAGMPLESLILEGTAVADLSPIRGMALQVLYLQDTPVTDLSVIQGMPLRELNLKGTAVDDVAPFADLPLNTLWIPDTNVSDIRPLQNMSLESLDVQDTAVSDLSPLAGMKSLRRLNIAGSQVTDLRPIAHLHLQRIILTPEKIEHGMEQLRAMTTLEQIWTSHARPMAAEEFWRRFDAGAWRKTDSSSPDAKAARTDTGPSAPSASAAPSEPVLIPEETVP